MLAQIIFSGDLNILSRVADIGSSTEVCTDSHTFENRCHGHERSRIGAGERVGAGSNSLSSQCRGQEADVRALIDRHLLEILVERGIKASRGKRRLRVIGQTLAIKGIFQMLQSQSIVENFDYSKG